MSMSMKPSARAVRGMRHMLAGAAAVLFGGNPVAPAAPQPREAAKPDAKRRVKVKAARKQSHRRKP